MMAPENFFVFLDKIKGKKILCVGDVMLDQFVYGEISRISPEAPVPVFAQKTEKMMAGGVGNVATNLAALGIQTFLVAVTGDDDRARMLSDVLSRYVDIKANFIVDAARPTTQKCRYIVGHQHVLRVDDEVTSPVSSNVETQLVTLCKKMLQECDAVILSDYSKGCLTPSVIAGVIAAAKDKNIPVLVDPKGSDYTRYKGASVVTPNRNELGQVTNAAIDTNEDIASAANTLIKNVGIGAVVATRSAEGMSVIDGKGATHIRARARQVFDVSGAGDTVIATLAASMAAGASLVDAAHIANVAAGLVVEKTGTATTSVADITQAIRSGDMGKTLAPVLGWEQARAQIEAWQAQGLKVGFTNGCFDIVHQGHVVMLDKCRAECDRLVLGLNTDRSIARLKGPTRPVNNQDARAKVIAALGSIDCVVMFGDDEKEGDTPLILIQALRPDIIFKGADYTVETVVGADFVQSYGGKVVLIPLEDGFSTTATIKKLGSAA